MGDNAKNRALELLAGAVLLLFALIWIWIGCKVLFFDPTDSSPTATFTEAQVAVAGFLSSIVAAGTASVLGIEIKSADQAKAANQATSLAARVNQAVVSSNLLMIGIGVYAVVGLFVLIIWVFDSNVAPDMMGTFALGVLGWLAGAFAAVFRADPAS